MSEDTGKYMGMLAVGVTGFTRSLKGMSDSLRKFQLSINTISKSIFDATNFLQQSIFNIVQGLAGSLGTTLPKVTHDVIEMQQYLYKDLREFAKVIFEIRAKGLEPLAASLVKMRDKILAGPTTGKQRLSDLSSTTELGKNLNVMDPKTLKKTNKSMKGLGKAAGKMAVAMVLMEPVMGALTAAMAPLELLTPIFEMFGAKLSQVLIPIIPVLVEALMELVPVIDNVVKIILPVVIALIPILEILINILSLLVAAVNILLNVFIFITEAIFGIVGIITTRLSLLSDNIDWLSNHINNFGAAFDGPTSAITDWASSIRDSTDAIDDENEARFNATQIINASASDIGATGYGETAAPF